MALRFPSLDALRLAITSGTVPEPICMAPAKAGFGTEGEVWLQPAGRMPRSVETALRRMGVKVTRSAAAPLGESLACWPALFPLVPDGGPVEVSDGTPVLFELPEPQQLAEVVAEVLRLGNDRQSFCHVTDGHAPRTLLHVIGPPYYSLLRALDRDAGEETPGRAPLHAYVEHRPRVWVQIGHLHPFADRLVPPAGRLLLIRAPRRWEFVKETPFQDVYQVLDYELPQARADWQPHDLDHRITIPLRLASGGTEAAELWVLRSGAEEQLDQLVGAADDQLLARLAFAVGERQGQRTIVLRARPSKQAPPVLVLDAVAFRPYLKLANLFVPCARRLHPPLRRNAVARLLAPEGSEITWLYPGEGNSFVPESLPDAAFRPLSDWVEYVLDRERESLAAWVDSHRFDFEPFVCEDDPRRPDRPPRKKRPGPKSKAAPGSTDDWVMPDDEEPDSEPEEPPADEPSPPIEPVGETKHEAAQKRLFELEQQFLALDSPLDGDDRAELWHRLAGANCSLGRHLDAAICWSTAIWERDGLPASSREAWLAGIREGPGLSSSASSLDQLLSESDPLLDHATGLASAVICAARGERPPEPLVERLGPLGQYIERWESLLPARTAWLAWVAIARLSGGDVLALARARDRALERLHRHGLRPELDLPTFLRTMGMADSARLRLVAEQIGPLHRRVRDWIEEPAAQPSPRTKEYAGLMFAYAMARLGDATACLALVEEVGKGLVPRNTVHRWVWDAFQFRIRQALDGQPGRDRLSGELLEDAEGMDRLDRYKVDRLRQNSRILEPCERIDPYRNWRRHADDFTAEVTALVDLNDGDRLKAEINRLFREVGSGPKRAEREIALLATSLELAPRLGEAFAVELADRVVPLLRRQVEPAAEQRVLEKALLASAHFDARDHVELFLGRIYRLLERQEIDQAAESLERMLAECFRGLRKLGMRDEIGQLLARLAQLVRSSAPPVESAGSTAAGAAPARRDAPLRLLLLVASGWLYFGQRKEAIDVVDEARRTLFRGELSPVEQTELVRAYVSALGHAPADFAMPRIEELFAPARPARGKKGGFRLRGIRDSFTTTSHFSLSQLKVVEATVLALVSEEFAMNSESRRWLDEDEFLVRRRIHRDVRAALAAAEA